MEFPELIGLIAGICTTASSIPQIVKTILKQKAADVSPVMFAALLAGNALWSWYGFLRSDVPVWATNIVAVGLDLTMLFLRFKYRKQG